MSFVRGLPDQALFVYNVPRGVMGRGIWAGAASAAGAFLVRDVGKWPQEIFISCNFYISVPPALCIFGISHLRIPFGHTVFSGEEVSKF